MTPEEEVRQVLASAPSAGPAPDDVRDRLDQTLAALVADRYGAGAPGPTAGDPAAATRTTGDPPPVADLAVRRARARRWPRVLVAAATVAVVAAGVGTVLDDLGGGAEGGDAGPDASSLEAGGAQESGGRGATGPRTEDTPLRVPEDAVAGTQRFPLRSGRLEADVAVALRSATPTTRADALRGCRAPGVPADRLVPVRLDGVPATLAVRAGPGGGKRVGVYGCDEAEPLVRTTLPAG